MPHVPVRRAAAAVLLAFAACAEATWSILIADSRTGEVAIGSATCLVNFDLQANTPVLIVGVGGATAQSYVDATGQNRIVIRDGLQAGTSPEGILDILSAFDTGHQTRQYGIVDTRGRAATFSGTGAGPWAGGVTGQVGDLVYAVQGNVLAGEPVVTAAVQAILDTPGDLAAKLMASMEAARAMGGDGRCSCDGAKPDKCGAPPPEFEKSAHIAYMLIARAGDRDGANGVYRAGSQPTGLVVHDFDADGRPDLLAGPSGSNDLWLLYNTTQPGDTFVTFAPGKAIPLPASTRDLVFRDVSGDGLEDIIAANWIAGTVSVLLGKGGDEFATAVAYPTEPDPRQVVVADLDGDTRPDIITANISASRVCILYGKGDGAFEPAQSIGVGGGMSFVAAVDLDSDGDLDLCFTAQDQGTVQRIYNLGGRVFQFGQPLSCGGSPRWILAHDLDHDGDDDLAVATGGSGKVVLFWNAAGVYQKQELVPGGDPVALAVGDADGDGLEDLFVMRGSARDFLVYKGDGQGGFVASDAFLIQSGNTRMIPTDLDGDGLDDLPAISGGNKSVYIVQNLGVPGGPILYNSGIGGATGDYFMEFNVAFAKAQDPDPVYTLWDMYHAWREDLIGRPDAVQSVVELDPPELPADGVSESVLNVALVDWQGQPAWAQSLAVSHAPGSDGRCSIGPVVDLGGGQYRVTITAGASPGRDLFRIVADDGVRPVTLMPDATLRLGCAADCDGSGGLDLFDFLCFVNRFNAGDGRADCDGSEALDIFDFLCFVNEFNACP